MVPEWYRDAKFGIWAHWGPQCQPEQGDWYAQRMYQFNNSAYRFHVQKYGHPSKFGFKDVCNEWKAEQWDPVALIALYKKAGAKFFAAMANHHDNMDMFDSTYQPWNSVKVGPKKDIVGGWATAARAAGLRKAEMAPLKDVQPLTGYIRGGVTLFGARKPYPVYIDETATLFDTISVSAGTRGVQLLLKPEDYLRAAQALDVEVQTADLTKASLRSAEEGHRA